MTRSTRYIEAVRAFETWRLEQRAKPADLFAADGSTSIHDAWRDEALDAVERCALVNRELTVMDVDFAPAIDNRARGSVMQLAARRGVLRRIVYVNGDAGRHGRPLVLWASQVYDPIAIPPSLEALDGVEHQAELDDQRRGFPPREPPIAPKANEVARADLTHKPHRKATADGSARAEGHPRCLNPGGTNA
jgi:hypothetical protein